MILRSLPYAVLLLLPLAPSAQGQASSPDPDAPRPIDAADVVFLEERTRMEVRDAIRGGETRAIMALVDPALRQRWMPSAGRRGQG